MYERRYPVFKILSNATGKPTSGFVSNSKDVFEARAWFLVDDPVGDVEVEWIADPPNCVEFLDNPFPWKARFKIKGNGTLVARATDFNGFTLDTPKTFVRLVSEG